VAQGVEILQRLDILTLDEAPESDLIEAAVDSVRTGRPVSALAGPARGSAATAAAAQASGRKSAGGLKGSTRACPNCGSPIAKADKFCTACGQKLKRQH
jgi:zinc ribbon protein